jgi:hypothetical protein
LLAGVEAQKGASVVDVIGEEPAKTKSKAQVRPQPSLAHPVKPLFASEKSPNPFRFLSLHGLYVHFSSPKNILFARYSPICSSKAKVLFSSFVRLYPAA